MKKIFFNDTATTEIYTPGYTLSLHDALPICNTYERFLEKHWHPKRQQLIGTVSVVGSVVTGLVIIYAVLAMLLPQLAVSISRMARSLPQMVDSISSMVDRLFEGNEIIQNYIMQLSDAGTESISGWLKDSILPRSEEHTSELQSR